MKKCLLALYSHLRHNFTHRLATMKEKKKKKKEMEKVSPFLFLPLQTLELKHPLLLSRCAKLEGA